MIKSAYKSTTSNKINNLINKGDYKYLNMCPLEDYNIVKLQSSNHSAIQKVSINGDKILGYFEAEIDRFNNSIVGTMFVKFKYTYNDEDYKIARQDLDEFIESLMNNYSNVTIKSIKDNSANFLYMKWVERYGGVKYELSNYCKLVDGKRYDVNMYYFDRRI